MLEDGLRNIRHLYYSAPEPIREIVGRLYRLLPDDLRLGTEYREFVKLLRDSRHWSSQRILDYQYQELRATLNSAYKKIPYYQDTFSEYGVTPADLKAPEDIARFPLLTKRDVKENYDRLINPDIPAWKHLSTTTGGSTAEPMRFLQIKGLTRSKERACIFEGWSRVGYQLGERAVQLKGRTVGRPTRGVYWEYEPIQNILEMDSNYLTFDRIPNYLKAIKKFGARFCIGYPSSIYLIALFLRESGEPPPMFHAIMLTSENVYPWQRQMMEQVFGCRVFSHYGHSEMILLGMEATSSSNLLFFPQYGYLELLNENGNSAAWPGARGEIVGTTFHNVLMPFIRYRTQDLGIMGGPDPDLPHYPTLSDVEGRLQEFIVTRDHRLISICVMGAAHFDTLDHVATTQYYQDTPGKLEFHVVPRRGYNEQDRVSIQNAIMKKVGTDVEVNVREVDNIERTRSGKHMMIIQKIPIQVLERGQDLVPP
jgi:phenylacetate-CoA ligase